MDVYILDIKILNKKYLIIINKMNENVREILMIIITIINNNDINFIINGLRMIKSIAENNNIALNILEINDMLSTINLVNINRSNIRLEPIILVIGNILRKLKDLNLINENNTIIDMYNNKCRELNIPQVITSSSVQRIPPPFIQRPETSISKPLYTKLFISRTCSICFVDFDWNNENLVVLKCGHIFHKDCIDIWINQQQTCPTCRVILSFSKKQKNKKLDKKSKKKSKNKIKT